MKFRIEKHCCVYVVTLQGVELGYALSLREANDMVLGLCDDWWVILAPDGSAEVLFGRHTETSAGTMEQAEQYIADAILRSRGK